MTQWPHSFLFTHFFLSEVEGLLYQQPFHAKIGSCWYWPPFDVAVSSYLPQVHCGLTRFDLSAIAYTVSISHKVRRMFGSFGWRQTGSSSMTA